MPSSTRATVEVNWQGVTPDRVVPIADGLLALVRHLKPVGTGNEWERFLAVLTDQGDPRLWSDPLPSESVLDSQLMLLDSGDAMLSDLVSDRSVAHARFFPRWHSVRWTKSRITVNPLGELPSTDMQQLRGVPVWDSIAWMGNGRNDFSAQLSLMIGTGGAQAIPQLLHCNVAAVQFSEPAVWNDQVLIAVCDGWKRIALWTFGRDLTPIKLYDIAALDRKGERARDVLGPVQTARIEEKLYLTWTHYQDRIGSKPPRTWNGRLYAASYDIANGVLQSDVLATDDVRVVGTSVSIRSIGDSVLVTYESRPQRNGGMRGFQFRSLEELPRKPDVIPLKTGSVFAVESSGVIFGQNQTHGTWIASESLPIGKKL